MAKYRSKPVTIEAEQWFPGKTMSFEGLDIRESAFIDGAFILTREGQRLIRPGYWVIRGTHGEYYGCHPDVFAERYEEESPARAEKEEVGR